MNFHLRNESSFKTELAVFPNKTKVGNLEAKAHFYTFKLSSVSTLLPAGGWPLFANPVLLQHNHAHSRTCCLWLPLCFISTE